MKPIIPHLWFDKEAAEAAALYTTLFEDSKVTNVTTIHDTPSGDTDMVLFELAGQPFMAISAGPVFKFNPSISLHVKCRTNEEADAIWNKLIDGGKVLMELGPYPFSERYGWLEDRYGLSWQIFSTTGRDFDQKIVPVLTFTGAVAGKTEEAINYYAGIFEQGSAMVLARYSANEEPNVEGTVKYAQMFLNGVELGAMDSAIPHDYAFNEAISFVVVCDTQEEIDRYWAALSAVPESEQCGWCKDAYGVSWQIVPSTMAKLMSAGTEEQKARVTQAFLKMKKFDIAALEKAFAGRS